MFIIGRRQLDAGRSLSFSLCLIFHVAAAVGRIVWAASRDL